MAGRNSGPRCNVRDSAYFRSHSPKNFNRLQSFSAITREFWCPVGAGQQSVSRNVVIAKTQFQWWYLKCSVSTLEYFIVSPFAIPSVAVYCLIFNFRTTVDEAALW
jgi:hypothetical protein